MKHLKAAFGRIDVREINAARLAHYANDRLDERAEKSTVRNELNILKRGMTLAVKLGLLATRPPFPTIVPTNIRTGFFERAELDAIVAHLPEYVVPLVKFMYWTGWRRGEVVSRQWRHVDLEAGVILLEPGETKNAKGRDFPFGLIPELAAVLAQQRAYTDAVQRRTGQLVPWLFHNEGMPIRSFRNAWKRACKHTGLARIPHDFRRTAARNLVRAGVTEQVAMTLTGHLTRSVFERYNITTDRDRREAVAKLAAAAPERQVSVLLDPNRTQKAAAQ